MNKERAPGVSSRKMRRVRFVLLALLLGALVLFRPAATHAQAAALLLRFSDPQRTLWGLRDVGVRTVTETSLSVPLPGGGDARARLYTPEGVRQAPGLVMVHGVHRLGMAEPRLVRFARAIAGTGIVVMTPEVRELADYRVDPASIATIGAAAHALHATRGGKVGVMGLSFAGGLALLAAADPRWDADIGYVVTVGAHDDLARVSHFFADDRIERPDGSILDMHAHDYGPLVLVYSHAEDFFPAEDVTGAREALRLWLWEDRDAAKTKAAQLGEASRLRLALLFDHHVGAMAKELSHEIDTHLDVMASVSPHGHLAQVHAPVFLLHGAGDNVIPPTETLWLAHDLPAGVVRDALVSPAVGHVELEGEPSLRERWKVVRFMAEVLAEAHAG